MRRASLSLLFLGPTLFACGLSVMGTGDGLDDGGTSGGGGAGGGSADGSSADGSSSASGTVSGSDAGADASGTAGQKDAGSFKNNDAGTTDAGSGQVNTCPAAIPAGYGGCCGAGNTLRCKGPKCPAQCAGVSGSPCDGCDVSGHYCCTKSTGAPACVAVGAGC